MNKPIVPATLSAESLAEAFEPTLERLGWELPAGSIHPVSITTGEPVTLPYVNACGTAEFLLAKVADESELADIALAFERAELADAMPA